MLKSPGGQRLPSAVGVDLPKAASVYKLADVGQTNRKRVLSKHPRRLAGLDGQQQLKILAVSQGMCQRGRIDRRTRFRFLPRQLCQGGPDFLLDGRLYCHNQSLLPALQLALAAASVKTPLPIRPNSASAPVYSNVPTALVAAAARKNSRALSAMPRINWYWPT